MDVQQPAPDPTLVEEQEQAQQADTQQVQQSLGQQTQNLWNMFGNGTQLGYVSLPGSSGAPAATGAK